MAALAFSAYGIHWFALGWNRVQGADARPNAHAWPVGLLFTGLALVYVAEFFASFKLGVKVGADGRESTNLGEKALGLVHIVVGLWLMYLTVATTLGPRPAGWAPHHPPPARRQACADCAAPWTSGHQGATWTEAAVGEPVVPLRPRPPSEPPRLRVRLTRTDQPALPRRRRS
jgi:hypothetical protein